MRRLWLRRTQIMIEKGGGRLPGGKGKGFVNDSRQEIELSMKGRKNPGRRAAVSRPHQREGRGREGFI